MLHGLKKFLEYQAYKIRLNSLLMTTKAGSGHPTSVLSCADIMAALFFAAMRYDPDNFNNPDNDHFILSKGHASPALYAVWNLLGKVSFEQLMTYRQFGSVLEGHATRRFAYAEAATGSLGMGLSIGAGIALAGRSDERHYMTYVLLGDSEVAEGSIWEAAELAAYYKLHRLVAIIDCNRLGQSTETMHGYHAQRYLQKFEAFGWKASIIDGHDMQQLVAALEKAKQSDQRPTVIVAKTIKGFGIDSLENKEGFHGKALKQEELEELLPFFEKRFAAIAAYNPHSYHWSAPLPQTLKSVIHHCPKPIKAAVQTYQKGDMVATRMAYGAALTQLAKECEDIVCLDAEVKNSTGAALFEQQFPERFFQCFIAEQNMIGMAIGFERYKKIPFSSTFSCFLSRAHDQLRMAAIGTVPLRVVGSHAGISIGPDGPSQMGLEDIAFMRALCGSVVLYPCDAVSTQALVTRMANFTEGISYLRTTREQTPVIYDATHDFTISGANVVRSSEQDSLVIVAAGITVHEALRAYELLKAENISVTIIDLYCIKPVDEVLLRAAAKKSGNKVITVEDHYLEGGLGEAVCYALRDQGCLIECLAVTKLPFSGTAQELRAWAGIDAEGIVSKVRLMTR